MMFLTIRKYYFICAIFSKNLVFLCRLLYIFLRHKGVLCLVLVHMYQCFCNKMIMVMSYHGHFMHLKFIYGHIVLKRRV